MTRRRSYRKSILSILFWSIISAAFIGPGTVTTAAKAGASFGTTLLWALTFSVVATILLQEAAARITIASGKNLGGIISEKFQGKRGRSIRIGLFLVVAFGCAAYQTGNLLGALAGLQLISSLPHWLILAGLGLLSFALLWVGNFRHIANLLSMVVALMGIAFLYVALQTPLSPAQIAEAAIIPSFPADSGLLIISLIGTTIVPYNLFLGSGITQHQSLREMRIGLIIAILLGGIISMAVMLVGAQIQGAFSFEKLSLALSDTLGAWAGQFFGFGLFVAGLTSSITAPLAAAVTARSLLEKGEARWNPTSRNFRIVWMTVLGIGLFFGLLQLKPIPAIILAQAINGALLPIVAIFLILAVNDRRLLGKQYTNPWPVNLLMLLIVGLTVYLGVHNMLKAAANLLPQLELTAGWTNVLRLGVASLVMVWLGRIIFSTQKKG